VSAGAPGASPPPRLLAGPLVWTVAWRFLRGSRSRLLDGTARAALLAIALGVTAMVIAMALMTGYREDLQSKLIRGNAAVVAYPVVPEGAALDGRRLARLRAIPGVVGIGRVAYGQGSAASARAPQGLEVTLRGVDPGAGQLGARAADLAVAPADRSGKGGADRPAGKSQPAEASQPVEGPQPAGPPARQGLPGAVLGSDLAARLGVRPGDTLRLVVLGFSGGRPRFRFQSVRVSGLFTTGFAEFDRSWVLLDRRLVERLMGAPEGADLLELTVRDPARVAPIAARATRILDPDFVVTDWQQLNRELFTALRLQQVALFLVLGLIVLVSTFNVASTLVVLVRERLRDIGVLGALGLAPRRLRLIFLAYGTSLGAVGTLAGAACGSAIAWVLTTFHLVRFDPEVAAIYFISAVPFRVVPRDLAAVVGFALAITFLACLVPAWRAARVDPSTALRYE
jgi:lipoprotein-releasing system permease protein